ncbi:hypothetical protein NCG97_25805 [Streptomyces lydicamycinicus]|uniref:hypothetical protein n=1 Tax=Streptomyces lydicamycinicus TaxID=1546107 RepID=UPI002034D92D|nr:hypothetical protein [Streptomyces lydicamycinicus]USA03281.1 hypothetical protein NCG97_25805 [Streptomyces lydicamycinicus]
MDLELERSVQDGRAYRTVDPAIPRMPFDGVVEVMARHLELNPSHHAAVISMESGMHSPAENVNSASIAFLARWMWPPAASATSLASRMFTPGKSCILALNTWWGPPSTALCSVCVLEQDACVGGEIFAQMAPRRVDLGCARHTDKAQYLRHDLLGRLPRGIEQQTSRCSPVHFFQDLVRGVTAHDVAAAAGGTPFVPPFDNA